jgi:ribose 5-phosphate isomerase RpiB
MYLNDTDSDRQQHRYHQADTLAAAGLLAAPDALGRAEAACGCGWCCASNRPDVAAGSAHDSCPAEKARRARAARIDPEEPR